MRRPRLMPLALLACCFGGGLALAARDDKREAERVLDGLLAEQAALSASARAEASALLTEPMKRARSAIARGDDARREGRSRHGALHDAVGLEWAETARDLRRAASAEAEADAVEAELLEVNDRIGRAKALLEDAVAREGRAQRALEELGAPRASGTPATSSAPSPSEVRQKPTTRPVTTGSAGPEEAP